MGFWSAKTEDVDWLSIILASCSSFENSGWRTIFVILCWKAVMVQNIALTPLVAICSLHVFQEVVVWIFLAADWMQQGQPVEIAASKATVLYIYIYTAYIYIYMYTYAYIYISIYLSLWWVRWGEPGGWSWTSTTGRGVRLAKVSKCDWGRLSVPPWTAMLPSKCPTCQVPQEAHSLRALKSVCAERPHAKRSRKSLRLASWIETSESLVHFSCHEYWKEQIWPYLERKQWWGMYELVQNLKQCGEFASTRQSHALPTWWRPVPRSWSFAKSEENKENQKSTETFNRGAVPSSEAPREVHHAAPVPRRCHAEAAVSSVGSIQRAGNQRTTNCREGRGTMHNMAIFPTEIDVWVPCLSPRWIPTRAAWQILVMISQHVAHPMERFVCLSTCAAHCRSWWAWHSCWWWTDFHSTRTRCLQPRGKRWSMPFVPTKLKLLASIQLIRPILL